MPSEPLFRYRRTKAQRDTTEITLGRSFALVLIAATFCICALVAIALGHAELLTFLLKLAKSVHSAIGHSRHRRGGQSRLFLQGSCHLGGVVDLAQLIVPWPILLKVPLRVTH